MENIRTTDSYIAVLKHRLAALTAERQKARREEQDYAAVRRNVEEFLSPPRQAPARQKDMELE